MAETATDLPWYETFAVGDIFESGPVTFTEDAIVDYARRWDPQPFHIDREAAAASQFGGLIASGMHVMAAMFRAMLDAGFLAGTGMGAPGLDNVRWRVPVRPGDVLKMRAQVTEVRASESRQDRGYVRMHFDVVNQRGEVVSDYQCTEIVRRRPEEPAAA